MDCIIAQTSSKHERKASCLKELIIIYSKNTYNLTVILILSSTEEVVPEGAMEEKLAENRIKME